MLDNLCRYESLVFKHYNKDEKLFGINSNNEFRKFSSSFGEMTQPVTVTENHILGISAENVFTSAD